MRVAPLYPSHPNYRPDIDGLRSVAVLLVVAYHAFPGWVMGGFIGVDIFFVISGYLISKSIFENFNENNFTFFEFYARRITRIFPALIIVLTFCLIFGWFALLSDEYKQLGKHIASSAAFSLNFVLWKEVSYFDNSADTKPLLHLWSLGIEEQFYILWPLFICFVRKFKINTLIFIITIAMYSFFMNIKWVQEDISAAYYSPITRFWELLIGAGLARLKTSFKALFSDARYSAEGPYVRFIFKINANNFIKVVRNASSFLGLLAIFYGLIAINPNDAFPGFLALIPTVGASLIIASDESAWINKNILSNRILIWLGLISFPLYLWHWPLLSLARIVQSEGTSAITRLGIILLSVALAHLTYRYVECPLRSCKQVAKKTTALLSILIFIGCFGFHLFVADGYEFRSSVKGYINNKNELIRSPAIDYGCLKYVELASPLFPYCRFSDFNSNETIAVIGDSHAHAAYPGISEFLGRKGINTVLLANSSCPPFIGVYTGRNTLEQNACKDRIEQLLRVVEKRDDISKVFVFTRGDVYISRMVAQKERSGLFAGSFITPQDLASAAELTFSRLSKSGKSVYYVIENPGLSQHAGACVNRPFKVVVKDCSVDKIDVVERQFEYVSKFKNLSNVIIIESLNGFCTQDRCAVFDDNGSILFADSHHLSVAGSRFLVEKILSKYLK